MCSYQVLTVQVIWRRVCILFEVVPLSLFLMALYTSGHDKYLFLKAASTFTSECQLRGKSPYCIRLKVELKPSTYRQAKRSDHLGGCKALRWKFWEKFLSKGLHLRSVWPARRACSAADRQLNEKQLPRTDKPSSIISGARDVEGLQTKIWDIFVG